MMIRAETENMLNLLQGWFDLREYVRERHNEKMVEIIDGEITRTADALADLLEEDDETEAAFFLRERAKLGLLLGCRQVDEAMRDIR